MNAAQALTAALWMVWLQPGAQAQQPQPRAPVTAPEIVRRYLAARGGLDRIKAVRTLVLRGPPRSNGRPGRTMTRARPFYLSVGTEGNDGSPWEAYDQYGLVARVTDAPAAALRHTAYFDDPLVMSLEPGWSVELTGTERFDGKDTYRLRVVFPDGWVNDLFVDRQSWLLVGRRFTAPFHAFGEAVTTETDIGDYREVNGALFPMRFAEYEAATGELLGAGDWVSADANVPLSPQTFSPPAPPDTPIARLVNAIFAARFVTADALGWYHDFRDDPETAAIDIEGPIESVAYHCLKSGAVSTGMALLQENLQRHPTSAPAHFGLGRAYRAAGREAEAVSEFHEALRLDPSFRAASQAIASRRLPY